MRYLILSDIHGNWEALEAVMADAEGLYDRCLNCGDLVGYGPDPNRVVEYCRNYCAVNVRGNHDKAVAGLADMTWFNEMAQNAVRWSRGALTPANLDFLSNLRQGPIEVNGFSIMHGSPADEDDYVVDLEEARLAAVDAPTAVSFYGHTHLQGAFFIHRNGQRAITMREFEIEETATYLINPGSVGQPRDGDSRAAYALYDTVTRAVELRRVEYPFEVTHRKILEAGLSDFLGARLHSGR